MQEVDVQLYVMKRLSMDRLSAAIMRVHAENGCSEPLSWDTFRKRLGQATQQLGYILQRCDDMKGLGAEDYPSGLLAECGGCWTAAEADQVMRPPSSSAHKFSYQPLGHEVYQSRAYMQSFSELEACIMLSLCHALQATNGPLARLHSVYIDWCFKIPHLKAADRSGKVEASGTKAPANTRFFVQDLTVLEHLDLAESRQPLPDDGKFCSDFKADEVSTSSILGPWVCSWTVLF